MMRRLIFLSPLTFLVAVLAATPGLAQLGPNQAVTVENGTGVLSIVDSTTGTVVDALALGVDAADVTVTPDGSTALVTSFVAQSLTFVDLTVSPPVVSGTTALPLLALDIDVACTSTGFAVITDGANFTDPSVGSNILSVNIATGALVTNLALDLTVQSNAITPDGTRVLAGSIFDSVVRVIDMSPAGVLTDTGQNVAVGINPRNVTISPDGQRALVANAGATVSVLDLSGPVIANIATIAFAGSSPQSIAFAPAGDHAYVLDSIFSRVYVLDVSPLGNVTTAGFITLSGLPAQPFFGMDQVAVSPDGTRLFARHPFGCSIVDLVLGVEAANVAIAGSQGGGVATLCDVETTCVEPSITSGLTDTLANEGDAVVFSVTATGDPAPTFQWFLDGDPLLGETMDTLTIDPVAASDAGTYSVVASNECGDASSSADLGVNQVPTITCNDAIELWSPNHRLIDVSSILEVQDANGDPVTLTIQVYSNEDELENSFAPDFKNELGGRGLLVRGERAGGDEGRWYAMVVTADDGNGGVTTIVCGAAACPHDKKQSSMDEVMAELDAAVAAMQAEVDAAAPAPPVLPLPGQFQVGLSAEVGPKQ